MANGWLGPEAIKKRNFFNISRQLCNSKAEGAACVQKCPHFSVLNWDCNSSALRPVISKHNNLLGSIAVEFAFLPAAPSLQMSTNSGFHSLPKACLPSCQGTKWQHRTRAWHGRQHTAEDTTQGKCPRGRQQRGRGGTACTTWNTACRETCPQCRTCQRLSKVPVKEPAPGTCCPTEKDIAGTDPSWHRAFSRVRGKAFICSLSG